MVVAKAVAIMVTMVAAITGGEDEGVVTIYLKMEARR
jgi:hypothetical protein